MLLTPITPIGIKAVAAMALLTLITPHRGSDVITEGAVVEIELCEEGIHCLTFLSMATA